LAGFSLGFGAAPTAHAGLVVYEGFKYKAGDPLKGQDGGTGWSGAWNVTSTGAATIANGSLADPSGKLATTGNSALSSPTDVTDAARTLAAALGGNNETEYISFLLDPRTLGSGNYSAGLLLRNKANTGGLLIGRGVDGSNYGLQDESANGKLAQSNTAPKKDTTVFLVVKAQFGNGTTNDTFSLYVNPTPGGQLPANPDATIQFLMGTAPAVELFETGGQWQFDEIRIGTTYASVAPTPEPGSLTLSGIAVSVLLGLHWMRSRGRRRGREKGVRGNGDQPAKREGP
jgi:hypothetical protein